MAFQINATTVVDDSRNLQNIANQSSFVGAGNAGLAVGDVGTYAWLYETIATNHLPGTTRAGSNLRFAGEWGSFSGGNTGGQFVSSPVPAGTWRCMGYSFGESFRGATLWLRIS